MEDVAVEVCKRKEVNTDETRWLGRLRNVMYVPGEEGDGTALQCEPNGTRSSRLLHGIRSTELFEVVGAFKTLLLCFRDAVFDVYGLRHDAVVDFELSIEPR